MSPSPELCGRCGHSLHRGACVATVTRKRASALSLRMNVPAPPVSVEEGCGCPEGIRTDLFANMQLEQLIKSQQATIELLMFVHDVAIDENGNPRRVVSH